MSARDELRDCFLSDSRDRFEAAADAHRAEVQAERDAQIVAWLLKKSHEYGTSNRENRAKSEAVWRMADKLSRGAVRPDGERAVLAEQAADEIDRLRARVAELEAAAVCPSVARLYGSKCVLPVRHRGDHRDETKRHYWSDEHAITQQRSEAA